MFKAMQIQTLWKIVSQVNVEEIRSDVERSFHLLIVAEESGLGEEVGCALSDENRAFVHPWLTVDQPPIDVSVRGFDRVDLALVVSREIELSAELKEARRGLDAAGVPCLVVIAGAAAGRPGASLARRGEGKRIAVSDLDTPVLDGVVAPALLSLVDESRRLALARRLPPLRTAAFQQLIQEASQANAMYSFSTGLAETIPVLDIPLNVGDLIVLTKNQLIMAYKIALVTGKGGTPQQLMGEIVSVLGGGFLFRQLTRQLVGLVPVWGIVPKTAVAYAGTWSIGQAVVLWAVEGQGITPELLARFYSEALARGHLIARQLAGNMRQRLLPGADQTDPESSRPDRPAQKEPSTSAWQRLRRRLPFGGDK